LLPPFGVSFVLRDDKRAHECERQGWTTSAEEAPRVVPPVPVSDPVNQTDQFPKAVAFSNLKKVFWPAEKYTKGDMIDYYRGNLAGGFCLI
jgi:hypothetical protein